MVYNPELHEECLRKPFEPYVTEIDFQGKKLKVQINKKNPENHSLQHILDDSPLLFHNLYQVIQNPDFPPVKSTSKNPTALLHQEEGEVYTFSKSGFIGTELGCPGYPSNITEDRVEVVVLFKDNLNPNEKHYTLTYHVFTK